MSQIYGYIEGSYNNSISWENRKRIVDALISNGMNTYVLASKRCSYRLNQGSSRQTQEWLKNCRDFVAYAHSRNIQILIGVSPAGGTHGQITDADEIHSNLMLKYRELSNCDSDGIIIGFDDIDTEYSKHPDALAASHATICNTLSNNINLSTYVIPRVYTAEIEYDIPGYSNVFERTLDSDIKIFHCGDSIVSNKIGYNYLPGAYRASGRDVVFWDNIYANDYCPRRIFLGPWIGRPSSGDIAVNLTGMVATDCLLLKVVAACRNSDNKLQDWKNVLSSADVPETFYYIANYLYLPDGTYGNTQNYDASVRQQLEALDDLIWSWDSELSLEWYPILMGLKQELLIASGGMSQKGIAKTQLNPFADILREVTGTDALAKKSLYQ